MLFPWLSIFVSTSADAFAPPLQHPSSRRTTISLLAKVKRGKLGQNVDGDFSIPPPPARRARSTAKKSSGSSSSKAVGNISPDLAKWMESQNQQNDSVDSTEKSTTSSSVEYKPFDDNDRRERRSARQVAEEARTSQIQDALQKLDLALQQGKKNMEEILAPLRALVQLPSSNLRQLTASTSTVHNYRLAWVGSDDAVCYVGTGLHKVPLARLQEVFLSLPGRNRVEIQEVIRVLGPFPNVKNVLQGASTLERSSENVVSWNIAWDSMIDGTGKEILAGNEGVRKVPLQVHFADPLVLIAVVPSEHSDPLHDNGKNVLVFVQEENLDEKLEALRVA